VIHAPPHVIQAFPSLIHVNFRVIQGVPHVIQRRRLIHVRPDVSHADPAV